MTKERFMRETKTLFGRCLRLLERKNDDYGNNVDPFKNFRVSVSVGVEPERAILVRLSDKISRVSSLLSRKAEVKDETIEDTIMDAINYLAILRTLLKDRDEKFASERGEIDLRWKRNIRDSQGHKLPADSKDSLGPVTWSCDKHLINL